LGIIYVASIVPEALAEPIEIACPGVHRSYEGLKVPMSVGDLQSAAAWFNTSGQRIPLVVGHPADESKPLGFGTKLGMVGDRLVITEAEEVDPTFALIVNSKELNKISAKVRLPGHPKNQSTGFEFRHVGFFGRSPTAMQQLKEAAFSQQDEGEFCLMPEDVDDSKREAEFRQKEAEFATRLAELNEREAQIAATEAAFQRKKETEPLIGKLLADGKLLPIEKPQIEAMFAALPDELEVSFSAADGEVTKPARKILADFLTGLKPRITYGETDMGEDPDDDDRSASFGGMNVSEESDELDKKIYAHCKKMGMDAENPAHYAKALKAVGGN
jgi:hypothetical protein